MEAKFVRVGNSQGLMIPIEVMRERGWQVGDVVELELTAGGLMVFDAKGRKDIAKIAQRLVRENIDLVRRLAKL
jgi:antitoxin component of MazEF toxin-antitoxin module